MQELSEIPLTSRENLLVAYPCTYPLLPWLLKKIEQKLNLT